MIRVVLPYHLRNLAGVGPEVHLNIQGPVTQRSILDALEENHPVLKGTIRDYGTKKRRAFLRFFVCNEDWTHQAPDDPLPEVIANGEEPFLVIGAIAGG